MSDGNDNVFSRWSRRKEAVRHSEAATPQQDELSPDAVAADAGAEVPEQPPAVEEGEAGELSGPLPRIEDLTAETDLSAFLRKGIPDALKSAALRKMWSLDPSIRDYVGPSEYAWDFNQPGSMAGFGPLQGKDPVAGFLKTMSGSIPTNPEPAAPAPEASDEIPETVPKSPDDELVAEPSSSAEVAAAEAPSTLDEEVFAEPAGPIEPEGRSGINVSPRHGGAMPR
jgi:Protein of unknown function (DUF3306)